MSKQVFTGIVVKKSGDKTIKVSVLRARMNPLLQKQVPYKKNFLVHDAKNIAMINDEVKITSSRPLSALKRFRLLNVIRTSKK
jgi:small subunit ribosomal protein S17